MLRKKRVQERNVPRRNQRTQMRPAEIAKNLREVLQVASPHVSYNMGEFRAVPTAQPRARLDVNGHAYYDTARRREGIGFSGRKGTLRSATATKFEAVLQPPCVLDTRVLTVVLPAPNLL